MAAKRVARMPRAGTNPDEPEFLHMMSLETDRGCWLIATAVIETAIDRLLFSFFEISRGNDDTDKCITELFCRQPLPPLGTLWVKTCLSRALGLIPADFYAFLNQLREHRNDFAHAPYLLEITSRDIQQLVSIIPSWRYKTKQILSPTADWFWEEMLAKGDSKQLSDPRKQFMELCRTAEFFIHATETHLRFRKIPWTTNPTDWVHALARPTEGVTVHACECPSLPTKSGSLWEYKPPTNRTSSPGAQ